MNNIKWDICDALEHAKRGAVPLAVAVTVAFMPFGDAVRTSAGNTLNAVGDAASRIQMVDERRVLNIGAKNLYISPNWAGYAAVSDISNPKPTVTEVNGTWIIPKVGQPCTLPEKDKNMQSDVYDISQWIGIGKVSADDQTLIQLVTTSTFSNMSGTSYSAHLTMLPGYSLALPNFDVAPLDTISASLMLVDSKRNMWKVEMIDVTKNEHFEKVVHYDSKRLSAEWISERRFHFSQFASSETGFFLNELPSFSKVQFIAGSGNAATVGGIEKPLNLLNNIAIDMYSVHENKYDPVQLVGANGKIDNNYMANQDMPGKKGNDDVAYMINAEKHSEKEIIESVSPLGVNKNRSNNTGNSAFDVYYTDCPAYFEKGLNVLRKTNKGEELN